jgi:hypothetical protein
VKHIVPASILLLLFALLSGCGGGNHVQQTSGGTTPSRSSPPASSGGESSSVNDSEFQFSWIGADYWPRLRTGYQLPPYAGPFFYQDYPAKYPFDVVDVGQLPAVSKSVFVGRDGLIKVHLHSDKPSDSFAFVGARLDFDPLKYRPVGSTAYSQHAVYDPVHPEALVWSVTPWFDTAPIDELDYLYYDHYGWLGLGLRSAVTELEYDSVGQELDPALSVWPPDGMDLADFYFTQEPDVPFDEFTRSSSWAHWRTQDGIATGDPHLAAFCSGRNFRDGAGSFLAPDALLQEGLTASVSTVTGQTGTQFRCLAISGRNLPSTNNIDFCIRYNSKVLKYVSVAPGEFWKHAALPFELVQTEPDANWSYVIWSYAELYKATDSGSGTIVTFVFAPK